MKPLKSPPSPEVVEVVEVAVEVEAVEETAETGRIEEAPATVPHQAPAKVQGQGQDEAPDTKTTLPVQPVTSTGNTARGRGTAPTDTGAPGETLRAPAPDTTETSWQVLKLKKIETLTSQPKTKLVTTVY